jgi:hypothetical protein
VLPADPPAKPAALTRTYRPLLCAVAFTVACAAAARAQVVTGTILGGVQDENRGAVPRATLTLKNVQTGATRTTHTDGEGRYRAVGLGLGVYEIKAERDGFQAVVRRGIHLMVGEEAVVDFSLSLRRVQETVFVDGDAPLVRTTQSALSHVMDEKKIRDLPLNGRDLAQLILLQPGAVLSRASANSSNVGQGIKISVGGARPSQNLFTLDGTDYNDALNNTPASAGGAVTGVETIKEFRVVTGPMSAEHGRAGGAVFNVVTKSGTNEFSGSAFEFFRNDALDAKGYFDERKPAFTRHQFGGSLGGPLVKDRTFFFVSYEGLREEKGITQVAAVLDDDARAGILPGRAPLAVPAAVRPYVDLFPPANGPRILDADGRPTGTALYREVFSRNSEQDFAMVRVDHAFTERDSVFARYVFDDSLRDLPLNFPQFPNLARNRRHLLTVEERRLFAGGAVNEIRLGLSRSAPREDVNPADPHHEIAFVPGQAFGEMQVTGLTEIGTDRTNPKSFGQDMLQLTDNVYFAAGRHALKAGFNFSWFRDAGLSDSRSRGRLRFRSLADFLQGITRDFELAGSGSDFQRDYRQSMVGLFLQDDYRASHRLTLNLGLRYEFVTTPREATGKVSNLRSIADPQITVGDPLFKNSTFDHAAPRVGFAWDVAGDGRTALSGGFGVFYEAPLFYVFRSPIFRSPPFVVRALVTRPRIPIDPAAVVAEGTPETESIVFDMGSTYNLQWSLGAQRELPFQSVVSLAYVGARGKNLFGQGDLNTAIPRTVDGQDFFPAGAPRRNPSFGTVRSVFQGFRSEYHGLQLSLLKRRSHGLQLQASYTYGDSRDNRSGVGGRQEWRNGQSRTFDPYDRDRDWGRSDFDVRHNFAFSFSYDLPLGGGRFGRGWQLNGIATLASGVAFTPIIPGDPDRDGSSDNVARPSVIPGVSTRPAGGPTADLWFNPEAFVFPGAGFRGNARRNMLDGPGLAVVDLSLVKTHRVAGRLDLQLRFEVFNVLNRVNLDIPINDPDGSAVFDEAGRRLPTAGKIFNTVTDPREAQLGIRFFF